jgi:hypothetical protein
MNLERDSRDFVDVSNKFAIVVVLTSLMKNI